MFCSNPGFLFNKLQTQNPTYDLWLFISVYKWRQKNGQYPNHAHLQQSVGRPWGVINKIQTQNQTCELGLFIQIYIQIWYPNHAHSQPSSPCCRLSGMMVLVTPQEEATAHLGSTVTLSCRAAGSVYEEELQWLRNSVLIDLQEGNRLNQSHLCVKDLTRDDHKVKFTCQLKSNTSTSASVKMNVLCECGIKPSITLNTI